ncbi:MAG TPA: divalent metal cation transporter [Thermoplasmata archaeon]|nr:divalent metal cation transporter [Thermoplasmata archaeon]
MFKKAKSIVKSFGPGIFILGANIGTGSVTTMSTAGAYHGMSLYWAVLLSCLFTWVMITVIGRLACSSGETIINSINRRIGLWAGVIIAVGIAVTQFFSTMGVVGVVSEATGILFDVNKLWPAIIWGAFIFLAIFFGSYGKFESLLGGMVTIFGLSFLITLLLVLVKPDFSIANLASSIPTGEFSGWITAGCVGTTFSSGILVMRSYVVKDKGWRKKDLKKEVTDAGISVIFMALLSGAVMACASATLFGSEHIAGISPTEFTSLEMAKDLLPLAGTYAFVLFTIGIITAGLSSALPNTLVSIWCLLDLFKLERDPKKVHFRALGALWAFSGVLGVLTGKPVPITVMAQAMILIITPFISAFATYLAWKDGLLGKKGSANERIMLGLCITSILFAICISTISFINQIQFAL